jgi:hypothetical protein
MGPESGFDVPDLRAVLLEVTTDPPRIRQNGSLFAREQERFLGALDPFPAWLAKSNKIGSPAERLEQALRWARRLWLTHATTGQGGGKLLRLTHDGQRWLEMGREAQYAPMYRHVREPESHSIWYGPGDESFLGSRTLALVGNPVDTEWLELLSVVSPEHKRPLREALYRLFDELPVGQFYSVSAFVSWASRGRRNPLLLGRGPREVVVLRGGRIVPPLEELLEDAAQELLNAFLASRLAPFGCVQLGRDGGDRPLVARLPRLDLYFGKGAAPRPESANEASRILVQPDFTVIVVGLSAAPAAELAPFCTRESGSAGQGSLTFRLSRESVQRGVAEGHSVQEILERLKKLASNALPDNVVKQLHSWGGQVCTVTAAPAILFRCADADAAGRVKAALGKKAELLGDTVVAWPAEEGLGAAVRRKLQNQGILVEGQAVERPKRR